MTNEIAKDPVVQEKIDEVKRHLELWMRNSLCQYEGEILAKPSGENEHMSWHYSNGVIYVRPVMPVTYITLNLILYKRVCRPPQQRAGSMRKRRKLMKIKQYIRDAL